MHAEPSPDLPGLNSLHARENDVYAQHRRAAIDHPHLSRVLRLIDDSLHFMIELAGGPLHTDDARTISAIAGRIFNTTAGALRRSVERLSANVVAVAARFVGREGYPMRFALS